MRAPNYKGIGDKGILEKKAPANPKFAAVQSTLDTGSRWRDDLTFTRPKRKNEYFGYAPRTRALALAGGSPAAARPLPTLRLASSEHARPEVVRITQAREGGAAGPHPGRE